MTTVKDLRAWLDTLGPESTVAIDDGGLTLVELDKGTEPTGAYLEVGGVPRPQCPKCGEELFQDELKCSDCGWEHGAEITREEFDAGGH